MEITASKNHDNEPGPEWGPAMSALSPKRRALVVALYDDDAPRKGDGLIIWATRKAGYGTPTSSTKSLSVIGDRIIYDAPVQAAIVEYSRQVLRAIPPEAIRALKDLIRDPKHRDHARAIAMVIDRSDPLQTLSTVKIEDNRPAALVEATEKVIARIEEIARRYNLAPAGKTIDGACRDVTPRGPA